MTILIANHIYEYVSALVPTGIELHVPDNAKRQKPPIASNVHIVPESVLANPEDAKQYIIDNGIEIIYAQGRGTMCFFSDVRKKLGRKVDVKIIATIHSGYVWEVWWKSILFLLIARVKSDGVVFLSDVIKKRYGVVASLIGLKTWVLKNPVDMTRFPLDHEYPRSQHKNIQFGYIGIITPNKNQDGLIKAIKYLKDDGIEVGLTLVGDVQYDWYLRELHSEINEYGLHDLVKIVPGLPYCKIPEFLYSIDCYVCPSKIEVMPFNVLEAMAAGLPVVATPIGGIPDLVVTGKNGVLSKRCSAEAMAIAIRQLLDGGDLERMGRCSREWIIREYSSTCFASKMVNVLTEVNCK